MTKRKPALRMAKALAERKEAEKGFLPLARAIHKLSSARKGQHVVDRRKLKAIVEGKDVLFRTTELRAIDRYLERFGEGLAHRPFFEKEDMLRSLAATQNVTFLLGSRLDTQLKRLDFSHWDVNGMVDILRGLNRFPGHIRFDIQEVRRAVSQKEALESRNAKWAKLLDTDGPSLVCLGSPRASQAAEIMLASMYDRVAFTSAADVEDPPFCFVWTGRFGPGARMPFTSTFAVEPEVLNARRAKKIRKDGYGLMWDGEFLVSPHPSSRKGTKSYAVVVAQRRKTGAIWIVVAGMTGVSTYAAAQMVPDIAATLNDDRPVRTLIELKLGEDSTGIYSLADKWIRDGPRWGR